MKYVSAQYRARIQLLQRIAFAFLVIFLFICIDTLTSLGFISRTLQVIDTHLLDTIGLHAMRDNRVFQFLKDRKDINAIITENKNLLEQTEVLKSNQFLLENKVSKLEQLVHIKSLPRNTFTQSYIVEVIEEADGVYYRLNIGKNSGIEKGAVVLTQSDAVLGKVTQSFPEFSIVRSLSASGSKMSVTIGNTQHSLGLLVGDLEFGVVIDELPITEQVHENDMIITSGQEKTVPAHLLIGKVKEVLYREGDLFQRVLVEPVVEKPLLYGDLVKISLPN